MSLSMLKMWVSFAGMILLFLALGLKFLSGKLNGVLAIIINILGFICLILGGLIILYIVFSGPTGV
ncbi:DUF2768 domain-containing protein [Ornithinibacillus gellani]|uniref:DUF2768 family protein n=1 Tax=Ornithinibacillus gellani TaxID=2293253 RepID=UPI000F464955|nr:DUF2768 family protein [Ornithinibacillus gellani]TQS74424.1 DUF2768 domain-containing protein [Ornithinibacillus gellani]